MCLGAIHPDSRGDSGGLRSGVGEAHFLAPLLNSFHHLAGGLVVKNAGNLQQILYGGTFRQWGDEPVDELGSPLLLFRREPVQVAQDLVPDLGKHNSALLDWRPEDGRWTSL